MFKYSYSKLKTSKGIRYFILNFSYLLKLNVYFPLTLRLSFSFDMLSSHCGKWQWHELYHSVKLRKSACQEQWHASVILSGGRDRGILASRPA